MIDNYIKEIAALKRQEKSLERKIGAAIVAAINEVAKDSPSRVNRISEHCFIIRHSDLIGKPWSPTFYNWEESGKQLVKYLEKKSESPIGWIKELRELKEKNGIISLKFIYGNGLWRTTTEVCIDARIVERVLQKI